MHNPTDLICGRPVSHYPDHPQLRELAIAFEEGEIAGEITDDTWRVVFISTEEGAILGFDQSELVEFYGKSLPRRQVENRNEWTTHDERGWFRLNAPIMRAYLDPGDPLFEEVFSAAADAARRISPADPVPRAWQYAFEIEGLRGPFVSRFLEIRLNDDTGAFLGVSRIVGRNIRAGLQDALARGDRRLYERMEATAEPARRPSAILFADLESSGILSRKLSSRAYFEVIRNLMTLIDDRVVDNGGIVGKHAGDGASALFITEQLGSESAAAAAAIVTAREITDGAASLGGPTLDIAINVGLHWGSTLTVGQVATGGRLEVTALGDEMNEAARIQDATTDGTVLASKDLIERLAPDDAAALTLDPDTIAYSALADLTDSEKALRDAGTISVASI